MMLGGTTSYRAFLILVLAAASAILAPRSLSAESFDWRNVNGYNWNTPIKSQFGGTCWDFGPTGAFEAKYMMTRNDPSFLDINPSDLFGSVAALRASNYVYLWFSHLGLPSLAGVLPAAGVTSVPEPSTLALSAAALWGLLAYARGKRR
ncbi:MAG: PEP-CTERM sorting domain-containing protein [Thermoguttaceae bacterium]|jgi:hypothetical protein